MKRHRLEDRADTRREILAGRSADARGAILSPLFIAALLIAIAFGWISPASAEENYDSGEAGAGGGEVSINGGEVYAGEGCVMAGEVIVGDCESGEGGEEEATSLPDAAMPEGGSTEKTTALEATSRETTASEDTASEGSVPEEDAACPTEPTGETHEATVERAIDGDTLEISEEIDGANRVRLIGVDSPETGTAEEGARPEPGAAEATGFTADALEGGQVVLELGAEQKDDYGRLLAYVWIGDGAEEEGLWSGLKRMVGMGESELFNLRLLDEGHADALNIEPNDAYAECFEDAERRAERPDATVEQHGGQTILEGTGPEQTVPEATTSEATENLASEESKTSREMASEETAPERPVPAETTAPEDGGPPDAALTGEQYEEPTTPEETAVERTTMQEDEIAEQTMEDTTTPEELTEASAPEPTTAEETAEETASLPESTTEAEPAPAPSITLEPETSREPEGEELSSSTREPLGASADEPIPEPVEEQYEPPEGIAEGPALETLPTMQTPEGSVPVLPDTGGASGLSLLASALGAACLVVGSGMALLAALGRRGRAPEQR